MKPIYTLVVLLATTSVGCAWQDVGEYWATATFTTAEGSSVVVRRRSDRADEIAIDFHGRRFVVPAEEIRKLPKLRYDSVTIAYGPGQKDGGIAVHFEMERDTKHPELVPHVMFLFSKDCKFTRREFYSSESVPRE